MLTGHNVLLILKILVATVTVILICSVVAIARGKQRLHGRLNLLFFALTVATLLGFEFLIRVLRPDIFESMLADEAIRQALSIHLCFSIPAAILMPFMLFTGLKHNRRVHLSLAALFSMLWIGTFVTGVFFLPHG